MNFKAKMKNFKSNIERLFTAIIPFSFLLLIMTTGSSCGSSDKVPLTYEDSLKVKKEMIELRAEELKNAEEQIKEIEQFEIESEVRFEDLKKRKAEIENMLKEFETEE